MASGFGLIREVDWASLFKSFYEVVRIKVAVRSPSKIPVERLFEMDRKLYLITITVEGIDPGISKSEIVVMTKMIRIKELEMTQMMSMMVWMTIGAHKILILCANISSKCIK
jgi:hypothetical protein